jgi:hypothetical protein
VVASLIVVDVPGTINIIYCGVWPIKCCQGSKTNKSNC